MLNSATSHPRDLEALYQRQDTGQELFISDKCSVNE